ncbi:MAG: hypothetical protein WC506_00600 [Candidatus Micrarchaeia archaeon]
MKQKEQENGFFSQLQDGMKVSGNDALKSAMLDGIARLPAGAREKMNMAASVAKIDSRLLGDFYKITASYADEIGRIADQKVQEGLASLYMVTVMTAKSENMYESTMAALGLAKAASGLGGAAQGFLLSAANQLMAKVDTLERPGYVSWLASYVSRQPAEKAGRAAEIVLSLLSGGGNAVRDKKDALEKRADRLMAFSEIDGKMAALQEGAAKIAKTALQNYIGNSQAMEKSNLIVLGKILENMAALDPGTSKNLAYSLANLFSIRGNPRLREDMDRFLESTQEILALPQAQRQQAAEKVFERITGYARGRNGVSG